MVALRATSARRDMPDLAQIAELLASVRGQRGDEETAATLLGMSQVVRGTFDAGNPEVRRLVADLKAGLGEQRYAELYRVGSGKSKKDALDWLYRMAGVPR
jgi:hypothetical protein